MGCSQASGAADRDTHGGQLHPETVAAYIAKYATKAAADLPTDHVGGNLHLRRLQTTLRQLAGRAVIAALTGGEEPYRGWGRWVDMLGFRGHLATKSRRYSTTLGRLRQARRDYARHTRSPTTRRPTGWADQDLDHRGHHPGRRLLAVRRHGLAHLRRRRPGRRLGCPGPR